MSANDIQVGGTHYKSEYGHWDWVTNIGMGYLAGNATKYLIRWRSKNGLEDLRKAGHYLDKLIEVSPLLTLQQNQWRPNKFWIDMETDKFVYVNNIFGLERDVCYLLSNWQTRNQLELTRSKITKLIEAYHNDESIILEKPASR